MPSYPAFALLIGSALAAGGKWVRRGSKFLAGLSMLIAVVLLTILFTVRNLPAPGDISSALSSNPGAYTLSLGHMEDLTIQSFAYLKLPLAVAAMAFLLGAVGTFRGPERRVVLTASAMMVLFFHAARLALVVFDPYMSSRPLAEAINRGPKGELIVDHHYYDFSSVFFYTNRTALLLNGRFNNLVYGSYAPGAPPVFIDDVEFGKLWQQNRRYYLVAELSGVKRLAQEFGHEAMNVAAFRGGKYLLTNHAAPETKPLSF